MNSRLANAQILLDPFKPKDGIELNRAFVAEASIIIYSSDASNDSKMEKLTNLTDGYQYLKHRRFWRDKK